MSKKKNTNTKQRIATLIICTIIITLTYLCEKNDYKPKDRESNTNNLTESTYSSLENIPEYAGEICVKINDNKPYFNEDDYTTVPFEDYSELDYLGRCGVAYTNVCKEIMPPKDDERGDISSVHPTGWKQAKFNGKYLYNRCHLIGYQLTGENANVKNLITCTRSMNAVNMVKYENEVADYVKSTNNHVLYRVTPIFLGDNLLATGVQIEALSVEDKGKGIKFNVFIYNVEDKIEIDYKTGESKLKTS